MNGKQNRVMRYASSIFTVLGESLSGYLRLFPAFLPIVLLIVAIGLVSIVIALPFWYFSTQATPIYTAIVLSLIGIALIVFTVQKLVRDRSIGKTARFIGLVFEFVLIMFLFYQKVFFYIPALVLSAEYIEFIGFTIPIKNFLSSWMAYTLIILGFCGFLYAALILALSKLLIVSIPLAIFYVISFGYLVNEVRKPRKRDRCADPA